MIGLVAAWAVTVWSISAAVAALAYWTWRTDFGKAATVLAFAGLAALYLAVQYLGHDFSPWSSILLGTVAALILVPTAAAYLLSRRERRSSSASRDIPAR